MAIGDSSSGQGHEEWAARYYQRSTPSAGSGAGLVFARDSPVTESTVVTTTAASASSSAPGGAAGSGAQPVSEGRVGKARRRSRASRKAPTTVLNTDTANFRAMVQQFTGVPTAPFQGGGYPQVADVGAGGGPATLSFGLHGGGAGQLYQRQAGFPFGVQQQPPPPQFQQHHERPLLFTLGGAAATTGGAYLRPGRGGGNPERAGMDAATEGLLLESIPPSQMMSRPAASSSGSSTTNRFLL